MATYPGLQGAVLADTCWLRATISNTPIALRSIPVWIISYQRLYLWRKIRPEVLRPGVWTRIRMPGF